MDKLIKKVTDELDRAKAKHPDWPLDAIYQASIVAEESGELTRAANQYVCEGGSLEALEEEVIQTAATCFRMLEHIRAGKTLKGEKGVRVYYKALRLDLFDDLHFADFAGEKAQEKAEKFKKAAEPDHDTLTGTIYKLKL